MLSITWQKNNIEYKFSIEEDKYYLMSLYH